MPGPLAAQANGIIGDAAPISAASVRDGLSNTMIVTEKAVSFFVSGVRPEAGAEYGWYLSGNWGDTLATAFYPPTGAKEVAQGRRRQYCPGRLESSSRRSQRSPGRWVGSLRQGLRAIVGFRPH